MDGALSGEAWAQSFGGLSLSSGEDIAYEALGKWIWKLMDVFKVDSFSDLKGQPARVVWEGGQHNSRIAKIGHFTDDKWIVLSEMMEG